MLDFEQVRQQVKDLRTRAEIRRKIRAEGDRIAKQLDDAASTIETLVKIIQGV